MTAALMTALSFTACQRFFPDNGGSGQDDNKPTQVALSFTFDQTPDMMQYCHIQVFFENGEGTSQTILLKPEDVDGECRWNALVSSHKLPATFTLRRSVLLDGDITELETFTYAKGIHYQYALYNAAGTQVYLSESFGSSSSVTGKGVDVAGLIKAGSLDRTCTFTFDAEGNMTKQTD